MISKHKITRRELIKLGAALAAGIAFHPPSDTPAVHATINKPDASGFIFRRIFGEPGHTKDSLMAFFSMRQTKDHPIVDKISPSKMPIFWCPEDGVSKKKSKQKNEKEQDEKNDKKPEELLAYINENRFYGTLEEFIDQSKPEEIGPKLPSLGHVPPFANGFAYNEQRSFYDNKQNISIDLSISTINGHLVALPRSYMTEDPFKTALFFRLQFDKGDLAHPHSFAGITPDKIFNVLLDIGTNAVNMIGDMPGELGSNSDVDLPGHIKTRRQLGDYMIQVRGEDYHSLPPCTNHYVKHFSIDIHEKDHKRPGRFKEVYDLHIGYAMVNGRVCFVFYNSPVNPICCYMCKVDKKRLAALVFNSLITVAAFATKGLFVALLAEAISDFIELQYNLISYQWQTLMQNISQQP